MNEHKWPLPSSPGLPLLLLHPYSPDSSIVFESRHSLDLNLRFSHKAGGKRLASGFVLGTAVENILLLLIRTCKKDVTTNG